MKKLCETKIICAWCDREIGTEEGNEDIRYSVCRTCLAEFHIFPDKIKTDGMPESAVV